MKRILTATATATVLAIVASQSAHASIAKPDTGNGELIFVVQNETALVSFTLDLGIRLQTFQAFGNNFDYNLLFNVAADSNWGSFVTAVGGSSGVAASSWAVLAFDGVGPSTVGGRNVLTTAQTAAGGFDATATQMRLTNNQRFSLMSRSGNQDAFFDAVDTTGTHGALGVAPDISVHGSSVNFITDDNPRAYFGESTSLTPNFGGNASFRSTNAVGQSSLFASMTRSSTGNLPSNLAIVTPFGGGAVPYATWLFNGQTLAYTAPIPEPSTYALLALGVAALLAHTRRRRVD